MVKSMIMKKNAFIILILSIVTFLSSCKKGEIESYPGFGYLQLKGNHSEGTSPLILSVDDQTQDSVRGEVTLPIKSGERHIRVKKLDGAVLIDTTLNIPFQQTVTLPSYFFNGSVFLVDDYNPETMAKPAAGKSLIRFIISDNSLPDELNIEIFNTDLATGISTSVATVAGIRKDRFSGYIELEDPVLLAGSYDAVYTIEATDQNGNKLLSLADNSFGFISFEFDISTYFTPNNVVSLGIGPQPADGSSAIRNPQVIFRKAII
jgi:hypothetical protein